MTRGEFLQQWASAIRKARKLVVEDRERRAGDELVRRLTRRLKYRGGRKARAAWRRLARMRCTAA